MNVRSITVFAPLACLALLGTSCAARPPSAPSPSTHTAASNGLPRSADKRGPNSEHGDAIGRLIDAPWGARMDKRHLLSFPLPDGGAWTHVRFWGVTTLAGWRYGDEHHAVAAAFTFPPNGEATVDKCAARFAEWGRERGKAFDILVGDPRVESIKWGPEGATAKIFILDAERRSLFGGRLYAAAYAVYPAWTDACLVVGVAAPENEAGEGARVLRDRLVKDALPSLVVKPKVGALALEAKSFDD